MSITNKFIFAFIFPVQFFSCTAEEPSVEENNFEAETVNGEMLSESSAADSSKNKLNDDFVDFNEFESVEDVHLTNLVKQDNLSENPDSDLLSIGSGTVNEEGETQHGRKQPLYVVDGVLVDFTRKASAGKWGDSEYQSATDIASLEKESVEILTGEKAIELYGDKGKYGVILITTKDGMKREISYIESSGDTTYTREDAATKGMMDLLKEQTDKEKNNR